MGFFDFVKKHHAVRATAYKFGELSAFVVTHIPRRGTDKATHGKLLHVFGHVDAHHCFFVVEQISSECSCEFSLANARRPKEHERADWSIGIGEPGAAATNCVCNSGDCCILTNDTLMQLFFEVYQFVHLAFEQFADRNTRPFRHDFGDVFGVDFFFQHAFG